MKYILNNNNYKRKKRRIYLCGAQSGSNHAMMYSPCQVPAPVGVTSSRMGDHLGFQQQIFTTHTRHIRINCVHRIKLYQSYNNLQLPGSRSIKKYKYLYFPRTRCIYKYTLYLLQYVYTYINILYKYITLIDVHRFFSQRIYKHTQPEKKF